MARRKYHELTDGEWIRPKMRGFREQCCACGLVHITDYRIVNGRVEFRSTQNRRATAAARRVFRRLKTDDE